MSWRDVGAAGFRTAWSFVALGLDPRARTTPAQACTTWPCTSSLRQQKPMCARLDSASAATKRAKAAWERARAKYKEAEDGVAAAADVLVNTFEAEKALREQARTECTKEEAENEGRTTTAELHEVLRNVIDNVEKAWPRGAQSPVGLQEAVTAARATLQHSATRTSNNSTHEKPKPMQKSSQDSKAQEDRKHDEHGRGEHCGLRWRRRWLHDFGGRDDAPRGPEHPGSQAVSARNDVRRRLRETSLRNTLHYWIQRASIQRECDSQASIQAHPEARNSTDTDRQAPLLPPTSADNVKAKETGVAPPHCRQRPSMRAASAQADRNNESLCVRLHLQEKDHCTMETEYHLRYLSRDK